MATFNKIISAIQVFLLVACSAEQGSGLRGGSSSRSGNPTYYSADNDEDFAEVPTPVAGAFQLLDCDYEQPSIRDKAVDIGCSVKDDQGELAEIDTLARPKLIVSNPNGVSRSITDCEDSSVCHWNVHLESTRDDVILARKMDEIEIQFTGIGDSEVRLASKPSARAMSSQRSSQLGIKTNGDGLYLGEQGASCYETCTSLGKTFDRERHQRNTGKKTCESIRNSLRPDGKIWNTVYTRSWTLGSFNRRYAKLHTLPLGCISIYEPRGDGNGVQHSDYEYYFQSTATGQADGYHHRALRYCYCR